MNLGDPLRPKDDHQTVGATDASSVRADAPRADGDLERWFDSPAGRYVLAWEQAQFDERVSDIFGFHALQLGFSQLDALRANRMPLRVRAVEWMTPDGADQAPPPTAPPRSACVSARTASLHY